MQSSKHTSFDIIAPISLIDYGIGEIARRIAGVAAFLQNDYCQSALAKSSPLHGFMQSLHDRLINYGWPLIKEDKLDTTLMPGERHDSDGRHVARAMHALAPFFEERAKNVNQTTSGGAVETALAADLIFAAKYLTLVLAADRSSTAGEAGEKMDTPDLTPLPTPPRTRVPIEHKAPAPYTLRRESQSANSPTQCDFHAIALAQPLPRSTSVELDSASPPTHKDEQQEEDSRRIDAILCSNRKDSRAWFEDDVHFADLIGAPHQWRRPPPENYCFIPSSKQHGPCHFCDAKPLGISALHVIAMQHPLHPTAVQALDIDILRFLRLALWDWTNASSQRKLERQSLEVVREEICRRKAKRKEETKKSSETDFNIDLQPMPKTPILCGQNGAHATSFPSLAPSFLDPYDNGNFEAFEAMYSPKGSPADMNPVDDILIKHSADNGRVHAALSSVSGPLTPIAECEEPVHDLHHSSVNPQTPEQPSVNEVLNTAASQQQPLFMPRKPAMLRSVEDPRRHAGVWDTAVLSNEALPQDNAQIQSLAQNTALPASPEAAELSSGSGTPSGVQSPIRSGASSPASENDEWLAPLRTSTSQSLRSSRGRGRIEDLASSRHKWQEPKSRLPNRIAMLRNIERIFDALKCNKDKDKNKVKSLDLNDMPVQRESQLRIREA